MTSWWADAAGAARPGRRRRPGATRKSTFVVPPSIIRRLAMIARLRRTREPRRIVGGTRRPRRSGSLLPAARCLLNHCGRRASACPADVAHQPPARAGSEAARREAGVATAAPLGRGSAPVGHPVHCRSRGPLWQKRPRAGATCFASTSQTQPRPRHDVQPALPGAGLPAIAGSLATPERRGRRRTRWVRNPTPSRPRTHRPLGPRCPRRGRRSLSPSRDQARPAAAPTDHDAPGGLFARCCDSTSSLADAAGPHTGETPPAGEWESAA